MFLEQDYFINAFLNVFLNAGVSRELSAKDQDTDFRELLCFWNDLVRFLREVLVRLERQSSFGHGDLGRLG